MANVPKKSNRKREAKLTRQADIEDDEFERFRAMATGRFRRLSASKPTYGGSLPSFCVDDSFAEDHSNETTTAYPNMWSNSFNELCTECSHSPNAQTGHLRVPSSPLMQRADLSGSGSDCDLDRTLTPRSPGRLSPSRFFSTAKTMLEDECDVEDSSPPRHTTPVHSSQGQLQQQHHQQSSNSSSLDVPVVNKCLSAPHSRSNSFKRKKVKELIQKDEQNQAFHERTSSMPHIAKQLSHQSPISKRRPSNLPLATTRLHPNSNSDGSRDAEWERVRNFITSPKGIINCGDSFRRSSSSLRSVDSWGSEDLGLRSSMSVEVPLHRFLILGGPGVGKTTLAQQFITSDCLVNVELIGELEDCISVSVTLDEQEATVDILELTYGQNHRRFYDINAYIVVYGTNDRASFHHAVDLLYQLCKEDSVQIPVILVANKTDLVRAREVAEQEGKSAAVTYHCKYFEVSSLMNHKVDELLAGILNQIRLRKSKLERRQKAETSPSSLCAQDCSVKSPMMMVGRMFRSGMLRRQPSKSCDNLLVL